MENEHQKGKSEFTVLDGKKTDFNLIFSNFTYLFNKTVNLFKKDPTNFIMAFALPLVVGGLLSIILFPLILGSLMTGGLVGMIISLVVYILCSIVLSVVAYVALIKAVVDVSKGSKLDIVELFRFGFAKSLAFIILGIKVLLTIFTGIRKFVNAWLSSIYFVENGGHVDQSIHSSQATAKGQTVTLLWAVILVGIVAALASGILSQIWYNIFWRASYDLALLGSYVINGLVMPFTIIAQFILKNELEKRSHHASPAHHDGTHHNA